MRDLHRWIVCGVAGWLSLASGSVVARQDMGQHAGHTGKLGTVHFPTSCAADVQPSFERSLAQLHSFEFREATEGFQAVLGADSKCGIAYWGIALAAWGNPFAAGIKPAAQIQRGQEAVERGRSSGSPTPRERGYIDAAAKLFEHADTLDQGTRLIAYRDAMQSLAARKPETSRRRSSTRCRWPSRRRRRTRPTPVSSRPARCSRSCSPRIPIIPAWRTTSSTPTTSGARAAARCRAAYLRDRASAHALHALARSPVSASWQRSSTPTLRRRLPREAPARRRGASRERLHGVRLCRLAETPSAATARFAARHRPGSTRRRPVRRRRRGSFFAVAAIPALRAGAGRLGCSRGTRDARQPGALRRRDQRLRARGSARHDRESRPSPLPPRHTSRPAGDAGRRARGCWTEQLAIQHQELLAWIAFARDAATKRSRRCARPPCARDARPRRTHHAGTAGRPRACWERCCWSWDVRRRAGRVRNGARP